MINKHGLTRKTARPWYTCQVKLKYIFCVCFWTSHFRSRFRELRFYDDLVTQYVITSQFIDVNADLHPGLECSKWVRNPQLCLIVSINNPFFHFIVREFYSNLAIEFEGARWSRLISRVSSRSIDLSIVDLHSIFYSPHRGLTYTNNEVAWSILRTTETEVL